MGTRIKSKPPQYQDAQERAKADKWLMVKQGAIHTDFNSAESGGCLNRPLPSAWKGEGHPSGWH